MSNFTYEFENKKTALEKYEWDNVWWDRTDLTDTPRVLYIGDSISCAARRFATSEAQEKLLFDGVGTSKAIDNPHFAELISNFAKQQSGRGAVLFNNGLHGWHLEDDTQYKEHYEKMLNFLLSEFKDVPIFLVLTTAVANMERKARVIARNEQVLSLAKKYSLEVIDLYSITDKNRNLLSEDGVHLLPEGYKLLAKEIVKKVQKVIKID